MTENQGSGSGWSVEPVVTRAQEPDWAALAEQHGEQLRRRRQLRAVAAGVAATAAIGGMIAMVLPGDSGAEPARAAAATTEDSASARAEDSPSPGAESVPAQAPSLALPSASLSASAETSHPAGSVTKPPPSAGASASARPPVVQPGATPTPGSPQTSPPPAGKSYTPVQVCGSGFNVIDSHSLGGATVYLLYKSATGDNCVTTIVNNPAGPVPMNATLAIKDGSSGSDPGTFASYAGPVTKHAPNTCVQWGGSYQSSSWTSGWTHCG
ncbi:hypothetical protein KCMC57_up59150 [Kitasatospora sp. CMC57]|uniref:Uncharacterized protein n=1 Tax=Kitasatospora sp. CMC57 TaxID=3231513 RepID=A0AB33K432_9ACTN